MDHINPESDCGSCLGCGSPIYGSDFLEPRRGYTICLNCVTHGCKLEPSSLRLIDETRARVEAMGLTRGPEFITAWQFVMAEVLAELEKLGIPVYGKQVVRKYTEAA
jgi:hypothetical protein